MQFAVVMVMILMGTDYGWRLHMAVVVIHLQEIDTAVTAMAGVDAGYPGALNIVF